MVTTFTQKNSDFSGKEKVTKKRTSKTVKSLPKKKKKNKEFIRLFKTVHFFQKCSKIIRKW